MRPHNMEGMGDGATNFILSDMCGCSSMPVSAVRDLCIQYLLTVTMWLITCPHMGHFVRWQKMMSYWHSIDMFTNRVSCLLMRPQLLTNVATLLLESKFWIGEDDENKSCGLVGWGGVVLGDGGKGAARWGMEGRVLLGEGWREGCC